MKGIMIQYKTLDTFYNHQGFNPHQHIEKFVSDEDYNVLLEQFPDDKLFKDEKPHTRKYNQRPHVRRFMCVTTQKESPYFDKFIVSVNDLPFVWQTLIAELQSKEYKEWICDILQINDFKLRFDFHRTQRGLDVSPHVDSVGKYASHLFYFMPKGWKEEYGGRTIFYKDKMIPEMNPEIKNFKNSMSYPVTGNCSLLFKNVPEGWHGVTEVKSDKLHRQLFNVIILK